MLLGVGAAQLQQEPEVVVSRVHASSLLEGAVAPSASAAWQEEAFLMLDMVTKCSGPAKLKRQSKKTRLSELRVCWSSHSSQPKEILDDLLMYDPGLSTDEGKLRVLGSVLGPSLQESH